MFRNQIRAAVLALSFASLSLPSSAAGPAGACRDIPVRVTLFANAVTDAETGTTVAAALQSDGAGEYINGNSASAVIKICSGTKDAVVNVSGTKRRFTFAFGAPIDGSVVQAAPSWVPGQYAVTGWINVRNITFSKQPFTTHMGATFTGPDRATYRLGFDPYDVDAPDLHSGSTLSAMDNTPYATSPAVVYPSYPEVCGPGAMPTWLVRGTTPNSNGMLEVATLHKVPSKGAQIHQGQYSLPFEMRIEAMQCFAY
jgi:hypothetical protein